MKSIGNWLRKIFPKVDRYASLRKFEVFAQFNTYNLYILNNFLHQRDFKAGEMIYEKGYPMETVLFIESGEVELFPGHDIDQGEILGSGEIIGLVDLFSRKSRSDHAKTHTDCTLFALSKADMQEMIKQNPELGTVFLTGVCAYLSKISANSVAKGQ
jgi:CRP-like cAMP-binding protein